jgi:diguanylate cyclase (GGDEF)-like protein
MVEETRAVICAMAGVDTVVLVRKIGMVFAGFVAINAILDPIPAWEAITALAGGYVVLNFVFCRSKLFPGLADSLLNLGICVGFTICNAPYSSTLYHVLLVTAVLGTGRAGIKRAAVAIMMIYLGASAYAGAVRVPQGMYIAFNILGFYILTYAAVHIQSLIERKTNDARHMKELIQQSNQHYRMALTDGLTGLYNYRAYKEKIETIPQYVIMILDIDHFKRLNDNHGHAVGDKVLIKLGNLIKLSVRHGDFAFRYGGEEFVVILPGATMQLGYTIAERLRQRVAQNEFLVAATRIPVTISVGIAVKQPSMTSASAFENADEALYSAKQQGRNNVQCYVGEAPEHISYHINCN